MTPKALAAVILRWQALLQLANWSVDFSIRPTAELPEGAESCMSRDVDSLHANLFFSDDREDSEREVEVIHELLHVAFAEQYEAILRVTRGYLPHGVRNALRRELKHQEEQLVIRLERAFVEVAK